jgi:hypothetical protein
MLPLYVPVQSLPAIAGLGIAGALLLWRAKEILVPGRTAAASGAVFRMINVYVLLVLSLLAFQVVA